MIGVAYIKIMIKATSTITINAGLTNLIVKAATNKDAIKTNSADMTDDVTDPLTNVFLGSSPNVLFKVSTSLSYIFILSPYYIIKAEKAMTPSLFTTKSGHKPIIKQIIKKNTIIAIVVLGTFAEEFYKKYYHEEK